MATQLKVGDVKTITVQYYDGAPDANGNPTGNIVADPATTVWTSSNPAALNVVSSGTNSGVLHALLASANGNVFVTITGTVPAFNTNVTSFSGFSGNTGVWVAPLTITIFSASFLIA